MGVRTITYFLSTLAFLWNFYGLSQQTSQCEPITIPMCMSMQWNLTRMPNILDQSSQQNARLKIERYYPLVQDRCSEHLEFFLCAIFAPICTTNYYDMPIPPCQEICEEVKSGCESLINNKYNDTWPEEINCSGFPQYNNGVCISPQAIQLETANQETETESGKQNKKTEKKSCNCKKKTKFQMKRYIQSKFDYTINAAVEGTQRIGSDLIISLNINYILTKKSDLKLRLNETLILWSEGDGCEEPCPAVRKRKEYLIACSKTVNPNNGMLVLDTDTCMISRYKKKLARSIITWDRISKMPKDTRKQHMKRWRHMEKYGTRQLEG